MGTKVEENPFNVQCIWPSMIIGETPVHVIKDWFKEEFDVRIADVEQVTTSALLDDGDFRKDMFFKMHAGDVPHFAVKRLGTEIKWWGDWNKEHYCDYRLGVMQKYGG